MFYRHSMFSVFSQWWNLQRLHQKMLLCWSASDMTKNIRFCFTFIFHHIEQSWNKINMWHICCVMQTLFCVSQNPEYSTDQANMVGKNILHCIHLQSALFWPIAIRTLTLRTAYAELIRLPVIEWHSKCISDVRKASCLCLVQRRVYLRPWS